VSARSILVVDDDAIVAFATSDYLRGCGFAVTVAETIEQGRAALAAVHHDVLIADLRLVGTDSLDGLDLANLALRQRRVHHAVVVTAWSSTATVTRAAVMGVAAVVNKPVPLAELAALITGLIASTPED
jgi:DNA-binding response OmpR family regulator